MVEKNKKKQKNQKTELCGVLLVNVRNEETRL